MIRILSIVAVLSGIIAWVLAVALIDRQGGGIESIVVKKPPQSKISYGSIKPVVNESAHEKTSETLSAFVHIPKAIKHTTQTSTETLPLYGWKIGSLSDPIPYCKETARSLTGYGEQISWLDVKCDNDGSRARFARRVFVQPDTTKNRVRILAANVEVKKMRHILTTMVNKDRSQLMSYMWGSGEFEGESGVVQVKINLLSLDMTDIDVRVSSEGYKVSFFFLLYATAEEISCVSCFERFQFGLESGASLDLEIIERKSGFSLDSEAIDWNNSFDVVVKQSSGFRDFRFHFPDKLKLGVFARATGTSDYEFKTKLENAIKKKMKEEIANKFEDISEEIDSKINKILTNANRVKVMSTIMKKLEKITTEGDIRVDLRSLGSGSSLLISLSVDANWFGRQVPDVFFQPYQKDSQINIKISYAAINKILESLLDDREIGTVINDVNQIFGGGRGRPGSLDDLLDDEFSSIMDELASTTGVEMGRLDAMKLPLRLRPVDKDTVRVFAAGITGLFKPANHRDITIYVFAEAQAGIDRGRTEEDIQHLRNHFSLEPRAIRENSEAMNRLRALSAVVTEVLEGGGDRWAELLVDSKAQNLRETPDKIDNKLGRPLADLVGRLTSNNRNLWKLKLMGIENDINQHALMVHFNIR